MAQKTFSQYLTARTQRGQFPDTQEEFFRAANKYEKAREAWYEASDRDMPQAVVDARYRRVQKARALRDDLAPSRARAVQTKAAKAFNPTGTTVREAQYIVSPRQGRRPIPEVCRQFMVEVRTVPQVDYEGTVLQPKVYAIAKLLDGKKIGQISAYVRPAEGWLSVSVASMVSGGGSLDLGERDDFSGCGIGTRLYEALAKYACKKGLKLTSDRTLFAPSQAFWRKQQSKGRAYTADGRYILRDTCGSANDLSGLKLAKPKAKSKRRRKG